MTSEYNFAIEEVRLLMRKINDSWLAGVPDEMTGFFHDDMVMKGPDFETVARGQQACIQSYKDFLSQCVVKDYQESEPDINVWGNSAVAVMPWKMTYELNGIEYTESGHDVFMFSRQGGKWLAVWRTIVSTPQ